MIFLHGIDINDVYPCHNVANSGQLFTVQQQPDIRSLSLDQLKYGPAPGGMYSSPRAVDCLMKAPILRNGQHIQMGVPPNTYNLSSEAEAKILKISDVELVFEEMRRKVAPQAPSRLNCLWLAANNEQGRKHIKEMLGDVYILSVEIAYETNKCRVDTQWFDKYWKYPNSEYVERYWKSEQSNADPKWEYLFEGIIKIIDSKQIEYVKLRGAKS